MITADFTRTEGGYRLRIQGHATESEPCASLVCAAASGIFYALCGYLVNRKKEGLSIRSMAAGDGDVVCASAGEEAMRFACIGLLQLALTYPAHLAVINRAFDWEENPK